MCNRSQRGYSEGELCSYITHYLTESNITNNQSYSSGPPHPIRDRPSAPAPLSISIEGKGLAVAEYYGCPYGVYMGDVWSIVVEQGCTRMVYVCYGCDRVCVWVYGGIMGVIVGVR